MRLLLSGLAAVMLCANAAAQAPLSLPQELALKASDAFRDCALCPEMVVIPPANS